MKPPKYWPWDDDPEGEIYENVSWDLPGFRPGNRQRKASRPKSPVEKGNPA